MKPGLGSSRLEAAWARPGRRDCVIQLVKFHFRLNSRQKDAGKYGAFITVVGM